MAAITRDQGFLMMELLMALFVITVALGALLTVFTAGIFGMRGGKQLLTTAERRSSQTRRWRRSAR